MQLDAHLYRVVKRSNAFYHATEPGHFLINAHVPAETPPVPPLYDFNLDTQLTDWLDYQLAANRPLWQAKQGLDDDAIPALCPRFGIAEHSAWMGMEVQFQQDTCLPIPCLKSPEDLDKLVLDENDKWFRYMKNGYDYLRSKKDGTFMLSVRGTMMPMDIANAIRGDEIFLDFMLNPDFAHKLMRFITDAIKWYYPKLRSWADEIQGGNVFQIEYGWLGPNCLGHVSNDLAMMCSAEIYEEFGFPYERELVEDYERVLYHVHNEKIHYVPRLSELPVLSLLEVSHDPKTPEPIEELQKIYSMTGNANLLVHATSEQVRVHIEELKARNVFLDVWCQDREDAEQIVAFIREHSKVL